MSFRWPWINLNNFRIIKVSFYLFERFLVNINSLLFAWFKIIIYFFCATQLRLDWVNHKREKNRKWKRKTYNVPCAWIFSHHPCAWLSVVIIFVNNVWQGRSRCLGCVRNVELNIKKDQNSYQEIIFWKKLSKNSSHQERKFVLLITGQREFVSISIDSTNCSFQ